MFNQTEYLVIEISDANRRGYQDRELILKLLCVESFTEFYTNGSISQNNRNGFKYNFAFIHQSLSNLAIIIGNIIEENKEKKILFEIHNTGEHVAVVETILERKSIKPAFNKPFNHWDNSSDPVWECLISLIKNIGNENDYNKYFRDLCNMYYTPLSDAIALRTELLTPLVALDLLTQIESVDQQSNMEDLIERACKALTDILDTDLYNNWHDLTLPEIEGFIKDINYSHWKIMDHNKLKLFADKIESRIKEIRDLSN
jgi:hypothetical protein